MRWASTSVQTLRRLIADKALDVQAHSLGLALSDETIADAVRNDARLKDPSGAFSRDRFEQVLRDAGLSERGFIAEQRNTDLRQQIGASLVDGLTAPKALVEALARVDTQSRAIDAVTLPPAAAGEIAAPTQDQLQRFFNDRKACYRAPEYRAVNVVVVTPTTLAKPGEVTDADARALYEKVEGGALRHAREAQAAADRLPQRRGSRRRARQDQGGSQFRRHRQGAQSDRQGHRSGRRHSRRRVRQGGGRRRLCAGG